MLGHRLGSLVRERAVDGLRINNVKININILSISCQYIVNILSISCQGRSSKLPADQQCQYQDQYQYLVNILLILLISCRGESSRLPADQQCQYQDHDQYQYQYLVKILLISCQGRSSELPGDQQCQEGEQYCGGESQERLVLSCLGSTLPRD